MLPGESSQLVTMSYLTNKNKKITETNTIVMSSTEPQSTFQLLSGFKKICGLPEVHFRVIFFSPLT